MRACEGERRGGLEGAVGGGLVLCESGVGWRKGGSSVKGGVCAR